MKKFLLFVSTVFLSLFISNRVYAQEYPVTTLKLNPANITYEQENAYTYEYRIYYNVFNDVYASIDIDEYFLVTSFYTPIRKGLNRNSNSYEITGISSPPQLPYTIVELTVTLLKNFVDGNYTNNPEDVNYIGNFFRNDAAFYVSYIGSTSSIDYFNGYEDGLADGRIIGDREGYNRGYNEGYNEGYEIGYRNGVLLTEPEAYQRGYDDAINSVLAKPINNLHIWLVPAIIIVVIAGIFVGYRKERYHD